LPIKTSQQDFKAKNVPEASFFINGNWRRRRQPHDTSL